MDVGRLTRLPTNLVGLHQDMIALLGNGLPDCFDRVENSIPQDGNQLSDMAEYASTSHTRAKLSIKLCLLVRFGAWSWRCS